MGTIEKGVVQRDEQTRYSLLSLICLDSPSLFFSLLLGLPLSLLPLPFLPQARLLCLDSSSLFFSFSQRRHSSRSGSNLSETK